MRWHVAFGLGAMTVWLGILAPWWAVIPWILFVIVPASMWFSAQ